MTYLECKLPDCGTPVFAGGLCRKHYERERLATAAPCSVSGCCSKAFRGTKCEAHYRVEIRAKRPLCTVPNCGDHQKNLTSGLCQKHDFRARRHGTIEQPRPADWGSREQHPLYQTWSTARRNTQAQMVPEWRDNFWAFVTCVGDKPTAHTMRRVNTTLPFGPDNWHWKKPYGKAADAPKYAREWRKNNPEKAKHANLKKQYGIGLPEYKAMAEAQEGECAICGGFETTKDKDGGPRMMPVDHDHKTGKVRALLCTQCNRGLGMFTDNIAKLKAAAAYLEKHLAPTPAS